jgi:carbonic anhydrase
MCELCGSAHHRLSRRSLMAGAGAALAASALPSARLWAAEPPAEGAPNAISPDVALQRLIEGNARYAAIPRTSATSRQAAPRAPGHNFLLLRS